MKKLLAIIVLDLLLSGNAFAEKKLLLCKDINIVPINNQSNMKNEFFSKSGKVLTISYGKKHTGEKIVKLWGNNMSNMVQFSLLDSDDEYVFEYPKDAFDASSPHWLNFKKKTFFDMSAGDIYKFISGSLNKVTLEGFLDYKIDKQSSTINSWSKTKDFLSISFKCEITKRKI
ncbi:hypothetical protein N8846_00015 [Pelagibacteraceae bacterium]|nr:hypothetical protein [Pelagibacteraceae bacterium]